MMTVYIETETGLHRYVAKRFGRRVVVTMDDVASARKFEKDFPTIFTNGKVLQKDDAIGYREVYGDDDKEDTIIARKIGFVNE